MQPTRRPQAIFPLKGIGEHKAQHVSAHHVEDRDHSPRQHGEANPGTQTTPRVPVRSSHCKGERTGR